METNEHIKNKRTEYVMTVMSIEDNRNWTTRRKQRKTDWRYLRQFTTKKLRLPIEVLEQYNKWQQYVSKNTYPIAHNERNELVKIIVNKDAHWRKSKKCIENGKNEHRWAMWIVIWNKGTMDIPTKGNGHSKRFNMFCVLSQNYQYFIVASKSKMSQKLKNAITI